MAKIGIVGTGSIARTYQQCIDEIEDARLVAMLTSSPGRVETVRNEFGVEAFSSMDAFLQQDMDVVCICNESGRHGEAIKAAAKAGKHVLCEKPLEVTLAKIDAAITVCKEQGVVLGCTLQNRCSADYRRVVDAVASGALGKLVMGNAHINWYRPESYYADSDWKGTLELDGGAAFINQGIHTIDLLLNLMGPVRSVFGKVATLVHNIEGEDAGSAIVNFENGAIGTITAGTALYPGYPERIEVYGENGSIILEGGTIKAWNLKKPAVGQNTWTDMAAADSDAAKNTNQKKESGASDPTAIGHQNHKKVLVDMLAAIRENRSPMVDGHEARKAVAVINAIYESSKKGELIVL